MSTKDSLDFLLVLDKKLHYIHTSTAITNISHTRIKVSNDCYTEKKMSVDEITKLLDYVKSGQNYCLAPINTSFGFAVGFDVRDVSCNKSILKFTERQLPKGYNFHTLSEVFMSDTNLSRAKKLDIIIRNDRDYYDY
jgi:hypothetical protein